MSDALGKVKSEAELRRNANGGVPCSSNSNTSIDFGRVSLLTLALSEGLSSLRVPGSETELPSAWSRAIDTLSCLCQTVFFTV